MKAVCYAIRNRQRAGWFNSSWHDILAHHQDWAATDKIYTLDLPDPRNYAFGLLLQEIDGIFSGSRDDDVTQGSTRIGGMRVRVSGESDKPVALYYGRLNDDLRPWFLENISRATDSHRLIATVGTLSFFS